ncbi:3-keto-5-aminohexanoate cleavage protein, partial [Pseudovibrio sp. POLY-S9]|uniref:3-keto-5-aminohexanoate cleavage protein n=1 Tax=Pseudovibrio sp. POLY-S9 TaxID=1576596 RepID=UPI00137B16D3
MTKRLIMSAPNGARRGKADHPQLPVTIEDVVACAVSVEAEGADALHAHVRGAEGQHVLDSGLYKELILEVTAKCPELAVQITTEAVGRYSAQEQYDVVAAVEPEAVSVAMREMAPEGGDMDLARRFYHEAKEAGRAVQHILYAPEDVAPL